MADSGVTARLPEAMRFTDGRAVGAGDWPARRGELLKLFAEHVYGREPAGARTSFRTVAETVLAGDGVLLRQIELTIERRSRRHSVPVVLFLPENRGGARAPCFVGLNFAGNETVHPEESIARTRSWVPEGRAARRGSMARRWPIAQVAARGYAVASVYHGDLAEDREEYTTGLHGLFETERREPSAAGHLTMWAWGLSRCLDALTAQEEVDAARVAVMGHSRNGKAALLAAARDERFAMAISNQSGCGGAALFRGKCGEDVAALTRRFPYWFCPRFAQYAGRESELPIDQHELLALIAPRPLLVCSAADDAWADPAAEFAGALAAGPVYQAMGAKGLPVDRAPGLNVPTFGTVGYHVRPGGHEIAWDDWRVFCDFADVHWRRGRTESSHPV